MTRPNPPRGRPDQFLPEFLAPHAPASLCLFMLFQHLLVPPLFHPPRKLLSSRLAVFGNSHLTQQPIHLQPERSLLGRLEILPITAPAITLQLHPPLRQPRSGRIQVHIVAHRAQIAMAASVHRHRLVPPRKQMTAGPVPDIEPFGIYSQQPFHPRHQIGLRRFDHQVKVIAHQAPGMDLPTGFRTGLMQGGQKPLVIQAVAKNLVPPISATHHMINRPGILNPQRSWHALILSNYRKSVNSED